MCIRKVLFLLLFCVPLPKARSQIQADDTSDAVMRIFAKDSTALTELMVQAGRVDAKAKPDSAAHLYLQIGRQYREHGLQALTLRYFLAATKLAESSGNQARIAWCYNDLGAFYKNQGNQQQALIWLHSGLAIFKRLGDRGGIGAIYNGLGDVYEQQGNYTEALANYYLSLTEVQSQHLAGGAAWPYFNIGEVYMFQGRYDSALYYYTAALKEHRAGGNKSGEAWTCNNIGSMLLRQKKYTEAEMYCKMAAAVADSLNEVGGRMNAYRNLAVIYESIGRYEEALQHQKVFTSLQAIVANEESTRNMVKNQMQYDFEKQQNAEETRQKEKDKRSVLIAVLLLLAVAAATVGFYFQRRTSMLRATLLRQKEEMLQQKEILMKEIHHRVRNNLQITGVLLNLQLSHITDVKARAALTEGITRVNAIALIHHQLYQKEVTDAISFSEFADILYQQLRKLFGTPSRMVRFDNNIPTFLLDIDTAVPLGLILNELITNSYKYAFTDGDNFIELNIARSGGNYMLRYADS